MAKCVQLIADGAEGENDGEVFVVRVNDQYAEELVKEWGGKYVPKSEWKKTGRERSLRASVRKA